MDIAVIDKTRDKSAGTKHITLNESREQVK